MKLFLLILLLLLPLRRVAGFESHLIGDLDIQLRSRSPSDMNEVLLKIMSVTVTLLDEAFHSQYVDDFNKVSLSVNSYGMQLVHDGYTAKVSFKARAFFQDGTSQQRNDEDITALVNDTFQNKNQDYLQALMETNDPFLQDVSYVVVKVNGDVVAQDVDSTVSSSSSGDNDSGSKWNNWMFALIAGVGSFLTVLVVCLICICCSEVDDMDHHAEVKKTASHESKRTTNDDDSQSNSPSPAKSIMSQDSSLFTYNPKSNKSSDSRTLGSNKSSDSRTLGSLFTTNSGVNVDFESWKRASTVQKDTSIFGNDISAIEAHKDLSLIEEGSEDEEQDDARNSQGQQRTLTEYALADLERGERSLALKRSRSSLSSKSRKRSPKEYDSADVITELNDLRFQIDRYRHG